MRRSFKLVVFYLFLTASANLLRGAGVTTAMGVSAPAGTSQAEETATSAASSLVGTNTGDNIFGLVTGVASSVSEIFKAAFALPDLLGAIGIPAPIIAFLFAPLVIVLAYDGAHILTGRLS